MTLQLLNGFPYTLNSKYSVKLDMVGSGDEHKETQLQIRPTFPIYMCTN
jgi:hypothetical protein